MFRSQELTRHFSRSHLVEYYKVVRFVEMRGKLRAEKAGLAGTREFGAENLDFFLDLHGLLLPCEDKIYVLARLR